MDLMVIGAGAIGGTIGALMAREGHDVTLCDIDLDHVREINHNGLTIEGPVNNFTIKVRAITPDQLPLRLGRVAVSVKSHHTQAVASLIRDRLADDGYVVSIQNGLTAEVLAESIGWEKLLVSFVNFGADVIAPGRIRQGNVATFMVGESLGTTITPRVNELVAALPYAQATANIYGFLWAKEAYGAMLYAGAVSDLSIADSFEDPRWRPLMVAIASEVLAQSPIMVEGFDGFDPNDLEGSLDRLVAFNRASAKSHSGIYRDLMVRHRKTEVDDLLRDLAGPLTTHVGQLIRAIERGERTCEVANLQLLEAYRRAREVDPRTYAVAGYIEAPLRSPSGPLHGVQVAVKDMISIKGQPVGNGNPYDMRSPAATDDAAVVGLLRSFGADLYVRSSMLEYAAGATNPEVQPAMNPRDPTLTAGGSSGGSAALVASGSCKIALGTDTGGSVRIPAHYCGVFGFKPSTGVLPLAGVTPLSPTLDHLGIIATDADWAAKLAGLLTGIAPIRVDARPTVGLPVSQWDYDSLDPTVKEATSRALERLRSHGCRLVEVDDSLFRQLDALFEPIFLFESYRVHGEQFQMDPQHFGEGTQRLLATASTVEESQYLSALGELSSLRAREEELYRSVDLLFGPTVPFIAPSENPPVDSLEGFAEGVFTRPSNLLGSPAMSIPLPVGNNQMPVGGQLMVPRGSDGLLLGATLWLEGLLEPE